MSHEPIQDPRLHPRDEKFLEGRYDDAKNARRPFAADWLLNLAYISGEQTLAYTHETGALVKKDLQPPFSDMTIHNAIMPIVRTERAKIHKTGVFPKVLPSKDTDDAHSAAKITEAWLHAQMRRWVFPSHQREASFWVVGCGNVLFHWYRDPNLGAMVDVVPPFEVFPDPHAKKFRDCRWLIHERFMSEEDAWDLFDGLDGVDYTALRTTSANTSDSPLEHRAYTESLGFGAQNLEGIRLRWYHEKPTKRNPKGAYIAFTETGIVWEADAYPHEHGQLPFTHAGHIERTSSKWHASIVDYLRGPQDSLNRREALIEENLGIAAGGKWWVPFGLELEAEPDALPRQILKGTGGTPSQKPEWIQPSVLDSWVLDDVNRVDAYMRDMAGQHEVSQGGVPGRVESGQAIQLLQEQDDSVMKDTIHSIEEALSTGFRYSLQDAKEYGDAEEFIRVYDQHGTVEVLQFTQEQIDLDVQIDVKITTSLPTTIAGRFDRVMNLVQYQVVTPAEARKLLELSTEDPDLDPDVTSRRRQHEEILTMIEFGEPIIPEQWQNHGAEIDELKKFMNGDGFKRLNPDVQQMLHMHLSVHEKMELIEAEKAGMLARVAQGEPLAAVMAGAQGAQPPSDPGVPGSQPPSDPGVAEPTPPDGQGPAEVLNPQTG